jgi:hypothetical protein
MYQQEVVRFCQGAADKEAGSYASNIRPKNIEEAIDELVAKDKTRSSQSSRSSSGVWRALLNWTWAVSGSFLNPNRFSIF